MPLQKSFNCAIAITRGLADKPAKALTGLFENFGFEATVGRITRAAQSLNSKMLGFIAGGSQGCQTEPCWQYIGWRRRSEA
ncbi:hypothetical protein XH97_02565 [Bradyrhizobium sp. CCBAU 53380]|nr:hypothetical protein [Bradyrhizobium sp. CCBAU 53380]